MHDEATKSANLVRLTYVFLHVVLGPLAGMIGGIAGFGLYGLSVGLDVSWVFAAATYPYVFVIAYLVGAIPALVHSVVMLLMAHLFRSRRQWMAVTPFVGFASSAAAAALWDFASGSYELVLIGGSVGCFAAVVCLFILRAAHYLPPVRSTELTK